MRFTDLDVQTRVPRSRFFASESSNADTVHRGRTLAVEILGCAILNATAGCLPSGGGNRAETDYTHYGFPMRDDIAVHTGTECAEAFRCNRP